jgi:hypothetical protein
MGVKRKPAELRPDRIVYSMRALGKNEPPAKFELGGTTWNRTRIHKHDFYAVTAFYESADGGKSVLKMGRTIEFAGFPLLWLGKYLCRRELHFYRKLSDLPNIPRVLGTVGQTGFVHDYVEGRPLAKDRPVPDTFFTELFALFDKLGERNVAYMDTNKPENILLGDDGKPYLIDFQISFDAENCWPKWLANWFLRRCRHTDRYHLLKHKNRLRPTEMTDDDRRQLEHKHWLIRLHRFLTAPYFKFRRRTFKRLRETGQLLPEGSK